MRTNAKAINHKFHVKMLMISIFLFVAAMDAKANEQWAYAWPNTDFSITNIDLTEVLSGGPPKDGIPPIDDPMFELASDNKTITSNEPVIGVVLNGVEKAYPLRILMWHEIANDVIAETPVAVTFCPLCNAALVFDRRLKDKTLTFGTTGKLRNSDLIMWDRQTESWWQQFTGQGIVGELTGEELEIIPSRLESFANFLARTGPNAQVLIPNDEDMRRYGSNPYEKYDGGYPFLYKGDLPKNIKPLARVISLSAKDQAWSLDFLKSVGKIVTVDGAIIQWNAGQNSALDEGWIAKGKDVGNVVVTKDGQDQVYFVEFAFAFYAFRPEAPIHIN